MIRNYDFSKASKIYIAMDDHNKDLVYVTLTEDGDIIEHGNMHSETRMFESYRFFEAIFNSGAKIIFKKHSNELIDKLKA